ncbi:MAG: SPFH domain-containing protein [Nostoc sp. SerVER01]|uniref:SPFH domain-containing protein n=1 Tax=Nostoc sp. CCY 9925 TaxID=3103865 RepID=UPI002ADC8B20|nr:SPFH domain-containing protein [Nostoc sp. SerVER01]MDZ8029125.1 SPFH domain-containing protein [Nostoc sp. DedQUE11]MDZ8071352.1 SPFH domain-containing protein [Nostoc sp. DedQUE01]MDZ8078051.1 SPFH domain-containing protein [Nostoc sp. DcaGUA01]MDZ8241305.1 SPFH domain-containing protein [Nostoc sp. ChiQUE01a]
MEQLFLLVFLALGGSAVAGSVKVVNQGNEALVERLGSYNKKLEPGLNFVIPFLDKIVYKETIREKVLDIPPQKCITRDNVSIEVDAVVYWRIVDMEKAWYKVENLQSAMVNLVLTQIRSEMGQLELDQTFTARTQINELLLQDLDVATDPWGVKVTRVELRDIIPSQAVQESMELQMSAERRRRAAILNSEGEREAAINSARGKAEAQILDAEARQKATILQAEAQQKTIVLQAQAERQQQVLKAQATAEALQIITNTLKSETNAQQALQFLLAQNYLEMGTKIGSSESSKVMFMDPRTIPATLEGMRSIVADASNGNSNPLFGGQISTVNNNRPG